MSTLPIITGVFIAINIFSLILMGYDKRKSIRGNGKRRTPEGILFFYATLFGATGLYLGMLLFRHKTRKWYFQIGVPVLIIQNIATVYLFIMHFT